MVLVQIFAAIICGHLENYKQSFDLNYPKQNTSQFSKKKTFDILNFLQKTPAAATFLCLATPSIYLYKKYPNLNLIQPNRMPSVDMYVLSQKQPNTLQPIDVTRTSDSLGSSLLLPLYLFCYL